MSTRAESDSASTSPAVPFCGKSIDSPALGFILRRGAFVRFCARHGGLDSQAMLGRHASSRSVSDHGRWHHRVDTWYGYIQAHVARRGRRNPIVFTHLPIQTSHHNSISITSSCAPNTHTTPRAPNITQNAHQPPLHNDGPPLTHAFLAPAIQTLSLDPHKPNLRRRNPPLAHTLAPHIHVRLPARPYHSAHHGNRARHHEPRAQRHKILHQEHRGEF
jgi:hypothetical protein